MLQRAYVEITNICNLSCAFCPGTKRPPHMMTLEEFRIIAEKLRPFTDYLYFHVMGEPLTHPHLAELLEIASSLGFRVCITTNGTLLRERGALLYRPCIHKVSVSLHSFEGNTGGDITAYLEDIWQFCGSAVSIVALRLWNEGGLNSRNREIFLFLSEKTGQDVEELPLSSTGNRRLRDRLFLESAQRFEWPSLSAQPQDVEFCHGLRHQIAVLCDGTVVPCCLDGDGSIPLGNLLRQDLYPILQSERAQQIIDGFSRRCPSEELCRRCGYATRFTL